MAVIRVEKNRNYTTMSNVHLQDKNISLKAKGLMSQMLSLPDTWGYSVQGLVAINQEGEKGIVSTLKELKDAGYVQTRMMKPNETATGRIEYEYTVYEVPPKTVPPKQGDCNRGTVTGALSQGDCSSNSVKGGYINNVDQSRKSSTNINHLNKTIELQTRLELSDELWSALKDFIEMRKLAKKPMTDRAVELLVKKLKDMASDERTQIKLINQSLEHGWLTIYPLKEEQRVGKTGVRLAEEQDHTLDEVFSLGSAWGE